MKRFQDYLFDRKQFDSLDGESFPTQSLECGVKQGSLLGPLLFLIYINGIQKFLRFVLFSDDSNILLYHPDLFLSEVQTPNAVQSLL